MKSQTRRLSLVIVALALMTAPAGAQQGPVPKKGVISANPFGLLFDIFNAEYETKISASATAGFGGSFFTKSTGDYLNLDAFWRFYPQGTPLEGVSFGAKVGITKIDTRGPFVGIGFDLNRSWVLGTNRNFYVGIGFGLKRLYGDTQSGDLDFVPTIRIINVGYAF